MNFEQENKKLIQIINDSYTKNQLIKAELLEISEEYENFLMENKQLKNQIKIKDSKISKLEKKNKELTERLEALRNSKLGKITRQIWKLKRG